VTDDSDYLEIKTRTRPVRCEEDDLAAQVRAWHESGELRHLHGRTLDLSDDSPDWFMRRTLKEQGFTHPLLERGREIDAAESEAEGILERLRRRRVWLTRPGSRCTAQQAHDFNLIRSYDLEQYREKLIELNRAIRDYNLTVPDAMHRRQCSVDKAMERVARAIPALSPPAAEQPHASSSGLRSIWQRMRGRLTKLEDRIVRVFSFRDGSPGRENSSTSGEFCDTNP
jgi:hypothetical protein